MAAVTICSDFGAQENSLSLFPLYPHLFSMPFHVLEKEMATHSSVLAQGRGSLVGCRLWGRTESDTTEAT